MQDYIVEQGTDGIWTYRKWSSGIAECWGVISATISHYATSFGGYGYATNTSFPSGLFLATPVVSYSGWIGNSFVLTGTVTTSMSKDVCAVYGISTSSGSQSTKWYVSAKGNWK